jgi:hypothetical protein
VVQNCQNSGHFFCFATIYARNFSGSNGAADSHTPGHIFQRVLHTIRRGAGDLEDPIYARYVFSDDRALIRHATSSTLV